MKKASWIFGSLLAIFVLGIFVFSPNELPPSSKGDGTIHQDETVGLGPADIDEILRAFLENNRSETDALRGRRSNTDGEIGVLREAIKRVGKAEARKDPGAQGILKALGKGDPGRLLGYLKKERNRNPGESVELDRVIAAVASLTGRIDEAEKALGHILENLPNDLYAISRLGHIHLLRGRLKNSQEAYERVLRLVEKTNDRPWIASASANLGNVYRIRGDLSKAEEMYRKSLQLNEELGSKEGMVINYGYLASVYKTRRDLQRAEEMYRKCLQLNEELGRKEGMAVDYGNLGIVSMNRGEFPRAEVMYRKSLQLSEELGHKEGMAANYGNLGNVYKNRGDLPRAEKMHRKSLQLNEELGSKEGMAADYANLGNVYQTRKEFSRAREALEKSLGLYRELGKRGMVKNLKQWLSELSDR